MSAEFILPGGLKCILCGKKEKGSMKTSILQYKTYAEFSVEVPGFNKRSDRDTRLFHHTFVPSIRR